MITVLFVLLLLYDRSVAFLPRCRLSTLLTHIHRPSPTQLDATLTATLAKNDADSAFVTTELETLGPKDVLPQQQLQADKFTSFPLTLVVDHSYLKRAALVSATFPVCSLLMEGRRGTCKSVIARSIHRLLPPTLIRIKDSPCNIDPKGQDVIDSMLAAHLLTTNQTLDSLPTEIIATPFVTVPLGVTEDALLGSVDLEQSLETGQTVFSPGLLAKAHRGIVYIDELNLLEDEMMSILFQVLADGFVRVEREGLSVMYPCRPLVLATYNPAEGELRDAIRDRFALQLSADDELSVNERVQAVQNVQALDGTLGPSEAAEAQEILARAFAEEQVLQEAVAQARDRLANVLISREQIQYLCETATRADCQGQRAEVFATSVAKASAALAGRERVNADDLELGVLLAIAPRGHFMTGIDQSMPPPPPSSPPPDTMHPPPLAPDFDGSIHPEEQMELEEEMDQERQQEIETEEDEDKQEETPESEEELQSPLEFMFGVDSTPVDPRLLVFNKRTRKGRGGKRSRKYNIERGRFVKAIFPRGNRGSLAVGATLRAAAPFQICRRSRLCKGPKDRRSVFVTKDDFRIKQMKKKTGSLIIFVVDASGSMALNRMSAAKGSAMTLLQEAYKSRDKVALIAFHGMAADVVVPPTKSMALARRRLEALPCGSKTPLADALIVAIRTGLNAIKVKQDTGKVIIVLISDGRANVPLSMSNGEVFDPLGDPESKDGLPSRAFLKKEVLAIAKRIGANDDLDLLVIDTEDKFVSTGVGEEIAKLAGGNYYHLARADHKSVARIVQQATEAQ